MRELLLRLGASAGLIGVIGLIRTNNDSVALDAFQF